MEPIVGPIRIPAAVSAGRTAKQVGRRTPIFNALLPTLVTNGFGPQRGSLI